MIRYLFGTRYRVVQATWNYSGGTYYDIQKWRPWLPLWNWVAWTKAGGTPEIAEADFRAKLGQRLTKPFRKNLGILP